MSTESILNQLGIDPDLPPSEILKLLAMRSHDSDEVERRLELSLQANRVEYPYADWEPPDPEGIKINIINNPPGTGRALTTGPERN